MHKYIIMGAQGSGKGKQANMLKVKLDLVHINVGDIFRWNIQSHTKLGAQIKRIVANGDLVPDEIVEEIVQSRLLVHDWNYGFILDGFPRNDTQARFFLERYDIDAVIHIDVPDEIVLKRVLSRRICTNCNLDYNLIFHRPKLANICDVCKSPLTVRQDDTEKIAKKRILGYHEKTKPILNLFRKKELVIVVDGTKSPNEVQQEILTNIAFPVKSILQT